MRLLVNPQISSTDWDQLILRHPNGGLLQSWAWGEFEQALGNHIWRLRVVDEKSEPVSQLLVIKLSLGFGRSIFYSPREVMLNRSAPAHTQHRAMELMVGQVRELAKTEGVILWRVDPPIKSTDAATLSLYRQFGFVRQPKTIQPRVNWELTLTAGINNLLTNMHPKTRYNIRLAEKKGVRVIVSKNPEDIRIFNQLNHLTATRDQFTPHSDNYYKKQLEIVGAAEQLELLIAYLDQTPLAAILISYFGKRATYLHGASSNEHREMMANHAIQWAAINQAQAKGCEVYDFGGITSGQEHPEWTGITRFKQGFGGAAVEYVGSLELPLSPLWYRLYRLLRR